MIADKYIRGQLYSEFTAKVLTNAAGMILKEQASNIGAYLNYRTGHIIDSLYQSFLVTKSGSGATLKFDYLIDLRFLDLKHAASGKKKKVYGPVYNRPLWGNVYGYAFGTLRYGLTETVQTEIFDMIRESYKKPLEQ